MVYYCEWNVMERIDLFVRLPMRFQMLAVMMEFAMRPLCWFLNEKIEILFRKFIRQFKKLPTWLSLTLAQILIVAHKAHALGL